MEEPRSWFQRFQQRSKGTSSKKKDAQGSEGVRDGANANAVSEEVLSNITKQKVAAAKQHIENHYKSQMKILQERRERYRVSYEFVFTSINCFIQILIMGISIFSFLNCYIHGGLESRSRSDFHGFSFSNSSIITS